MNNLTKILRAMEDRQSTLQWDPSQRGKVSGMYESVAEMALRRSHRASWAQERTTYQTGLRSDHRAQERHQQTQDRIFVSEDERQAQGDWEPATVRRLDERLTTLLCTQAMEMRENGKSRKWYALGHAVNEVLRQIQEVNQK